MKILLLSILFITKAYSNPKEFTNMLVVNSQDPFLIEIFETSNKSTAKAELSILWPSAGNKPARLTFNDSETYCKSIGLELPSTRQWMLAASNNNQNKYYTLRGDGGLVNGKEVNFNIANDESINVTDIQSLGIDAIGTVGLTGNRAEWAKGPDGGLYQCGGDYSSSLKSILLENICKKYNWEDIKATARCIYPLKAGQDIKITLKNLKREHIQYIESINADVYIDHYLNSFLINSEIEEDDLGPTDPEVW